MRSLELKKQQKKENSGQSLVEVLIALVVVSLVALGLVKATNSGLRGSGYSKDQSEAVSLAQEKISEIIGLKNQNSDFFDSLPSFVDETFQDGKFCLKTTLTDTTADLPPETPDLSNAQAFTISADVFWDAVGAGSDCNSQAYSHTQHFQTNVTQ